MFCWQPPSAPPGMSVGLGVAAHSAATDTEMTLDKREAQKVPNGSAPVLLRGDSYRDREHLLDATNFETMRQSFEGKGKRWTFECAVFAAKFRNWPQYGCLLI
jgi:hypothetical protein